MKKLRKTLAALMAMVLCASMVLPVSAKEYNAEDGTVHVDGTESWQNEDGDKYDHAANDDYVVDIKGGDESVDHTVVEVTENTPSDMQVNIDNVDANVEKGPAADIQGGSVDISNSSLSTGDEDHAAVEIGGNADVTISGDTTVNGNGTGIEMTDNSSLTVNDGAELEVNGSRTEVTESAEVAGDNIGIDMKDDSSLTVEENGKLTANGSSVNVNVTNDSDAEVTVNGGNTGIQAGDNSEITVKGEAEINGSVVTGGNQNQAVVTVRQEGNVGLNISDSSKVTVVDGGELTAMDTQDGLNGSYTTSEISRWNATSALTNKNAHVKLEDNTYVLLTDMLNNGQIYRKEGGIYVVASDLGTNAGLRYFIKGTKADGTPNYVTLKSNLFYPSYSNKKHNLDHEYEGEGTGVMLSGNSSIEVDNEAILKAYGEKNAIELTGDTTVRIGESGLLRILGGPVSIGEDSSLTSAGIIYADDIRDFIRGSVSGHDAIDFQGTGLHFLSCKKPASIYTNDPWEVYIYWDIGEEFAEKELEIHFSDLMNQARKICNMFEPGMTPSDEVNFHFVITNNSRNAFAYDADSLNVGRYSMEELVEKGSKYWPMRTDNFALRALYNPTHDPTTDTGARNLKGWGFGSDRVTACTFDQMLNVEQYLKETGYDNRTFNSLDEYYLYFVNKMNGTQYQSLKEVPLPELGCIFSMEGNYGTSKAMYSEEKYRELSEQLEKTGSAYKAEIVGGNNDSGYVVILRETGEIREAALNYFYQQCLQFGYGSGEGNRLGIDDYRNEANMAGAEKLMAGKLMSLAAKGDPDGKNSVTIDAYYGLDAQKSGNFTEFMEEFWWTGATLSRIGSDPEVPDPDEPDPEVPVPDVPSTPDPGIRIDEPGVPLAFGADIEIDEPGVPLAAWPVIEIDDPDVPLASVPQTGDSIYIWEILTTISGIGLALLAIRNKKRREDAL